MTAVKPRWTCDVCRLLSPGWHTIPSADPDIPDEVVRCPTWLASKNATMAQAFAAGETTAAKEAAHRVITDAAHGMSVLNANTVRDRFEDAQVPSALIPGAFTWAKNQRLIEKMDTRVMSTEKGTRHEVAQWRSLVYRRASGVAS